MISSVLGVCLADMLVMLTLALPPAQASRKKGVHDTS